MIRITVAIPAHNEAAFLPDAVRSVMEQSLAREAYEVLVIDNASTDETVAVMALLLEEFAEDAKAGRLRLISEMRPGLSHARNRALAEARGEFLALLDADAVATPGWLGGLEKAFSRSEGIVAVGGAIYVRWDHPQPGWWDERLAEAFNYYDRGGEGHRLEYPRYPYGTNLALRVEAARKAGGFLEGLGRKGRQLLAGEDGEMCLRLEKGGGEVWYAPGALVYHRTTESRLTRGYILRRAFHHGRSQYLMERVHGFESGRYLGWSRIVGRIILTLLTFRCGMPFLKFITFRIGYHRERLRMRWGKGGGIDRRGSAWRSD